MQWPMDTSEYCSYRFEITPLVSKNHMRGKVRILKDGLNYYNMIY